mmetsp:Transcript_133846/g.373195  ORF Transcript_133846/g.373195 Transcript_133846/m.373195 type:complete len:125 (-) Transcript_133846:48-422(-)
MTSPGLVGSATSTENTEAAPRWLRIQYQRPRQPTAPLRLRPQRRLADDLQNLRAPPPMHQRTAAQLRMEVPSGARSVRCTGSLPLLGCSWLLGQLRLADWAADGQGGLVDGALARPTFALRPCS